VAQPATELSEIWFSHVMSNRKDVNVISLLFVTLVLLGILVKTVQRFCMIMVPHFWGHGMDCMTAKMRHQELFETTGTIHPII
jgi:hypothetical protein